ncbi:MAG TPA: DUF4349 domain-containing protein [Clostridiales bacterium]|nr:DUF4349 domain-containing protein [Clostridiales bacterium]
MDRKRKNIFRIILILSILIFMITGCAKKENLKSDSRADYSYDNEISNDNYSKEESDYKEYEQETEDVYPEESTGDDYLEDSENISNTLILGSQTSNFNGDDKIIKIYDLYLETMAFDILINNIDAQISVLGGYVESSNINGNKYFQNNNYKRANIVARIPKGRVDVFLNSLNDNANVVSKSESSENVALEYSDSEGRKKSLEIQYERVLGILGEANELSDILILEERLNSLRYEIEREGRKLKIYDNLVDFSSITLTIEEVKEITTIEDEPESTLDRIKQGFTNSLNKIKEGLIEFVIALIAISPYLLIWAVILFPLALIIRNIFKKKKKYDSINKNTIEYKNMENGDNNDLSQ